MKVLILGGTGAMGVPVVQILADRGHNVDVTTRSKRDDRPGVHYVMGDAHNLRFIQDVLNAGYNKSFPIFRTIDFCKKAPLLSHLQIPAYTLTELFCKNYTTLQIKSGIAPSVACQIVLKSIVYIVLFCHNWTIYFTQFS